MSEIDYRQIRRYANSDLSELAAKHFNKPRFTCLPATLDFGSAFHTLILEPDTFDAAENLGYMPILNWMRESVETDTELVSLIQNSEHETVRTWIDEATGLPCKAKLDAVVLPKRVHIIDLKSTMCTSKAKFIDTCHEYDYDRQAAFYLSSDPNARFFELVGVRKTNPYTVYRTAYHRESEFVRGGFKKVNRLLRLAKETGFVPGSWGRGVAA